MYSDSILTIMASEAASLPLGLRLMFRALVLHHRSATELDIEDEITPSQEEIRVVSKYLLDEWLMHAAKTKAE